jgi:hypothetical protein
MEQEDGAGLSPWCCPSSLGELEDAPKPLCEYGRSVRNTKNATNSREFGAAMDEEAAPVVRHRTVSDVSLGSSVSPGSAGVTER